MFYVIDDLISDEQRFNKILKHYLVLAGYL